MDPPHNDRLLRAAKGDRVDRPPVWVMRQAGRYLQEFKNVRKKYNFFHICQTPELASKVTLQPLKRFKLDAVIIFSDILVIPQALGMSVEMLPEVGPSFPRPLKIPGDLALLECDVDVDVALGYVYEAISLTCQKLEGRVPCIGFCGAPWTLMCYMIEGRGSQTVSGAKKWLYAYPKESHILLDILTNICIKFLVGQARAGARYLQVFDTLALHLGRDLFVKFAFPCLKKIAAKVKDELKQQDLDVPMCVFSKGTHHCLEMFEDTSYDVVGLDWTVEPAYALQKLPTKTLQGNLDPGALYSSKEDIEVLVKEMVAKFGGGKSKYIANLGHGVYPDCEPENMKAFVDAITAIV